LTMSSAMPGWLPSSRRGGRTPDHGGADDGFVAQLSCGPRMSRYYLQCALSGDLAHWPDQRIWDEIRLRLRDLAIVNATVHDKELSRCGPWSTCRCSTAISFLPAMLRNSRLSRPPVRPRRVVDLNRASDGGGAGHANIAATLIGRSISRRRGQRVKLLENRR
jgi:hypothetical protein